MRIAILVDHFPSLSETFILQQITGLIKRGHHVDIYANSRGSTDKLHPQVREFDLLERAYFAAPPRNKLKRLVAVLTTISNCPNVPIQRWLGSMNPFRYGRYALSLRLFYDVARFAGKPPYDIIHCQLEPMGLQGMLFRNMGFLHGRLVTSWRGHDFPVYVHRFSQCTYPNLYAQGDRFLPVSDSLRRELLDAGCSDAKIHVLRSGINLNDFPFTLRTPDAQGDIVLLSIGRLVENKGLEYGIRAVAKLVPRYPGIRYRIVGDGPLMDSLQSLVKTLGLEQHVVLTGWQLHEQVRRELQQASILVTPSFTADDAAKEGIPNVLKEAMAMGVPVIGSDHSGIPELITDGENGFLVPEKDADAIAAKIDHLLVHPEIWEDLERAARAHIEAHYDIEKLNDELEQVYRSVL